MLVNLDIDKKMDTLKNPDIVPRKGRPYNVQKSRQMIPLGEKVRTKKTITCSNCGSHEHNRATCPNPIKDAPSTKRGKNESTQSTCIMQATIITRII